jgi:(p)ppGpp synthase/HD superfamily hydrolase
MNYVLVDYAKYFAIGAHGLQKRKYTNEPYWIHLQEVVNILSNYYPSIEAYIVAWLHDVVEDTWASSLDIQEHFGENIAKWVSDLTLPPKEFGNRAKRYEFYNKGLINSCELVQTVKYADILHNTISISKYDPDFAKVYLEEIKKLLPYLNKGEPRLYKFVCKEAGLSS